MDHSIDGSNNPLESLVDPLVPSRALIAAPVGARPDLVRAWFDRAVETSEPVIDGSLESERAAADTYRRMAKAENTRRAYRSAVRAWCLWCAQHDLSPLPASGADVAAFLAGERGRQLLPETLKLRRAAIRYLQSRRRLPGADRRCLPSPRPWQASLGRPPSRASPPARKWRQPRPSCGGCWRRSPRICAVCGTGRCCWSASQGHSRRSELAAIRFDQLEKTDRGGSASPCPRPKASRPTRGNGPTALWGYRTLSGACARTVAAGGQPDRGGRSSAGSGCHRTRKQRNRASPLPSPRSPARCPGSAKTRSPRKPWHRSFRPARWRLALIAAT